ncbi:MAG TPA: MBL fold metallo-hydrolase [Cytophagaceae bacterium]|nr:MBL fold metallo-hydrolase [Cytophagaceae bacterium]
MIHFKKTWLFIFSVFLSCSSKNLFPVSQNKIPENTITIGKPKTDYPIVLNPNGRDTIELQYLGCGGFSIKKKKDKILIDPFFPNIGLLKLGVSGFSQYLNDNSCALCNNPTTKNKKHKGSCIRPDTCFINTLGDSNVVDFSGIQSVLITHAHHDHLLDVPHIYNRFLKNEKVKIIGNESTYKLIQNLIPTSSFIHVEDSLTTYQKNGMILKLNKEGTIIAKPILSDHAPHLESVKLFDGEVCNTIKDAKEYYSGTHAHWWREGKTLDYLIEFIESKDTFRIFLQTSASCPKFGFLPDTTTRIDLAILGIASYQYACNYPDEYIARLKPKQILLAHWEDFFVPYGKKNPKLVRGTDVKGFLVNYKKKNNNKPPLTMVEPLTKIILHY